MNNNKIMPFEKNTEEEHSWQPQHVVSTWMKGMPVFFNLVWFLGGGIMNTLKEIFVYLLIFLMLNLFFPGSSIAQQSKLYAETDIIEHPIKTLPVPEGQKFEKEKPKKPFYKKWWFWAIIASVGIGAGAAGGGGGGDGGGNGGDESDTGSISGSW